MHNTMVFPKTIPDPPASVCFDLARWIGLQPISGVAPLVLAWAGAIDKDAGFVLATAFSVVPMLVREALWALGRQLDHTVEIRPTLLDTISRFTALVIFLLGLTLKLP